MPLLVIKCFLPIFLSIPQHGRSIKMTDRHQIFAESLLAPCTYFSSICHLAIPRFQLTTRVWCGVTRLALNTYAEYPLGMCLVVVILLAPHVSDLCFYLYTYVSKHSFSHHGLRATQCGLEHSTNTGSESSYTCYIHNAYSCTLLSPYMWRKKPAGGHYNMGPSTGDY